MAVIAVNFCSSKRLFEQTLVRLNACSSKRLFGMIGPNHPNFKRQKNREDGSDLDENLMESIAAQKTFI